MKSLIQVLPRLAIILVGLSANGWSQSPQTDSAEWLMQSAKHKELVDGDLESAVQLYRRVVESAEDNRALVASALMQLGACYEKLGDREALKAYERVIRDFPTLTAFAHKARDRVAAISQIPAETPSDRFVLREVASYALSEIQPNAVSRDGRYCTFVDWENTALVVRDLITDSNRRLVSWPGGFLKPRWMDVSISPDSRWVAYARWDGSEFEVQVVDIAGSQTRELYSGSQRMTLQGWTSDSENLLVAIRERRDEGILTKIAFIARADGTIRVLKEFTAKIGRWTSMRLSPDDQYVAYARGGDASSGQQDIFLTPVDGRPEIHLIENEANEDVFGWAPDGELFLFRRNQSGPSNSVWAVRFVDGKVKDEPYSLCDDIPNWGIEGPIQTPGGGTAFYVKQQSHVEWDALVANADHSTGRLLGRPWRISSQFANDSAGGAWSADGKHFAFGAKSGTGWPGWSRSMVVRSLETENEREIPLAPEFCRTAESRKLWSSDGRFVFFLSGNRPGNIGIGRLEVETGEVSHVVPPSEQDEVQLVGTATDGNQLYYAFWHRIQREQRAAEYSGASIWVKDVTTGDSRELYRVGNELIGGVRLSPDGQRLAFTLGKSESYVGGWWGFTSLMTLSIDGGQPRELFRVPETEQMAWTLSWLPDGRHLLISRRRQGDEKLELCRISIESGEPEPVDLPFSDPWDLHELSFHPHDSQLTFTMRRPGDDVRQFELFTSNSERPAAERELKLPSGYVAETFYDGIPRPDGIAVRPDGSLLVVNESEPQGVFIAKRGQSFDLAHAFSTTGAPFVNPDDILLHPNGAVFVADIQKDALLKIPPQGGRPEVFVSSESLGETYTFVPFGIAVASTSAQYAGVKPGDLIVTDLGESPSAHWLIWVIDPVTGDARPLELTGAARNLSVGQISFGGDGTLHTFLQQDKRHYRLVSVDQTGAVQSLASDLPEIGGGLAIHPTTGQIYFGLQQKLREIWRVPRGGGEPVVFASGFSGRLQDLVFSSDGQSLFVSETGRIVEIKGPFGQEAK